jgi:antitoxin (DNA-binding transcriptional repressor) of toxin-antitoxin stability system
MRPKLEVSCASAKNVYFGGVKAILAQLQRDTAKVVRRVNHGGDKPTLAHRDAECARIVPRRKVDRKKLLEMLRDLGPIDLPSRK